MTAHAVAHRHRIQGRPGIAYRYRRLALLLFLAGALPATAQERSRQIDDAEERIANLQRDLAALENEYFQQTQVLETSRRNLAEQEPLAAVGSNWEAAANHYLEQIRARKQAFEDASARLDQIPPEDQSWLDHVYLGFIKAPQRRIPRAVSGLYEKIAARFDWLTYHRTIEAEMRAGIQLAHEPYRRRFEGVEDFVRQAQAEVLKSETARANCVTYRENIARAERRQSEIDDQQRQLRAQIRQLQQQLAALHNQAVEPPARTSPDLADPEIVDATCSQLEGSPGSRAAFWRFYVRLNVRNHVPVQLRLTELSREPSAQDPDPKRRFPTPRTAFTVNRGDTFQLGGWEDSTTGVPILEQMVSTGMDAIGNIERIPTQLDLGPYYLTVWEDQGFEGRFSAVFEAVRGSPEPWRRIVEFRPPPPPTSQVHMRVDAPDAKNRQGPAGALMPSFAWHDPYHIRFVVHVPDLTPGLYRLRIQVRGQRDRFLWARAKEGERQTTFHGFVPMGVGPYELTLSVPEAPQVTPVAISGALEPGRGSTESLANSRKRVQEAEAKLSEPGPGVTPELRRWWLGDMQVAYAQGLNLAGRFAEALEVAEQAIGNLPEYQVTAQPRATGREYQDAAWKEKAIALYHLHQRDAFRQVMQHVGQTQLRIASGFHQQGNASMARDYERRAGLYCHLLAHRLMLIGVDLAEVRQIVEQGNQLYQRSGLNPPKLAWYPE